MYWFRTGNAVDALALIPFFLLFTSGGWLISTHAFKLEPHERILAGIGIGLGLNLWFVNLLGRWLPPQLAFWAAAGLVLILGFLSTIWSDRPFLDKKDLLQVWPLLLLFIGIALLFTLMGRGLGIFDDRKNLSIISTMAAGDIPPHFYMNSGFLFKYHYGFQLFGASLMRVGGLFPWSAFDLSKGITAALAIALAYLWGWRVTYRRLGGVITAFLLTFASGSRWLLTLLPPSILSRAGAQLTLWGSGAQSAPDLLQGLSSVWHIASGPPVQIPFAFVNGILQPFILYLHAGPKSLALVLFLTLLLIFRRANRFGLLVLTLLLAMWGLTAEAEFVLFAIGLFATFIILRAWRKEPAWRFELCIAAIMVLVASTILVFQGGTITETVKGVLLPTAESRAGIAGSSAGFSLRFPPAIVSAHLGELRVTKLGELAIGLAEIGPALLLLPFVVWASIRWMKRGRYVLVSVAISTFLGFLIPFFLRYEVDRDITRLTNYALLGWLLLSIPLVGELWRLQLSNWIRTTIMVGAAVLVFGGFVVMGSLLTAIPRAIVGHAIEPVDAAMTRLVWDELEDGAEVLDKNPWRAVPITGRLTRSSTDTYADLESWTDLVSFPDVHLVSAAGYRYIYMDRNWWDSMPEIARDSYLDPCVKIIQELHDNRLNGSRWLFDIDACGLDA